jgi:hypothetical protein
MPVSAEQVTVGDGGRRPAESKCSAAGDGGWSKMYRLRGSQTR